MMKTGGKKREENEGPQPEGKKSNLVAKKAFVITHNEYHRPIKEGEDISDVPALYHPNLKTEGVL